MPQFQSSPDFFLEVIPVQVDSLVVQQPNNDLRFGVVEADTEQALAMIFDLHHSTVFGWGSQAQGRAGVDPWMSGDNAVRFARFQNYSR